MALHNLKPPLGSVKSRKRKGRGPGSGNGKTAGSGHGGHKSRSGGSTPIGFEGGQMPLHMRLPKRGFSNYLFRKHYTVINVADLERYAEDGMIDFEILRKKGVVTSARKLEGLKVLGKGEITLPLIVKAKKFSASAVAKIEAAGGKIEVIA